MMPALLTIIVPVHNREHLVQRTLNSIYLQDYRPLKVIIVDNDSTDSTLSTILQWCSIYDSNNFRVTVAVESIPGAAAARNAGLRMVDTPWTMFFDSDDVMLHEHVSNAMMMVEKNPDVDLIGWDVDILYPKRLETKRFSSKPSVYNCIMDGTMATQRYMARTVIFRAVGGWNDSVMVWNDIEIGTRILQFPGLKTLRIKGIATVIICAHDDSITGPSFSSRSKEREYALKVMSNTVPPQLNYVIQLKRVILAANYYKEKNRQGAKKLYMEALSETYSAWNRCLMKVAYHYTRLGGRGAAKLLKRFFVNEPDIDSEI